MVNWNKVLKEQLEIQKRQIAIQEKQNKILDETRKIYFWLLLATFLMALISTIGLMTEARANQLWLNLFYGVIVIIALAILVKLFLIISSKRK